ncbi:hypothetical protein EDB92DRAFT_1943763 [Lactarius akahatsu]|uniref:Uncharacterized protein n=1 Tax=Lactarius akahatsu TaxID=416441 RepID=A0AAD4QC75_9AGAM|nr:hypothetical protein EDB92DRAFT_1943763 [Lactarius akahatsu]
METMVMTMPSPANIHSHSMSELDIELVALLDSLSLQQHEFRASEPEPAPPTVSDIQMSDAGSSHSAATAPSVSSDAPSSPAPCAFLQALTHWYDPDAEQVQTTCGEYLELIFIHREAFAARPASHTGCSAAFSALARSLELRAWRADRDADTEAVAAFRHEAWMVAAWMSSGGPWWRGGEKTEA